MTLPPPPRNSAGPAPKRVPGSVRRTSSIDAFWPDGQLGNRIMIGHARDIVTPATSGPPTVLAEDSFRAILKPDRTIVEISADPPRPKLSQAALEGKVPLRTFGELSALFAAKKEPEKKPEAEAPPAPPPAPPPESAAAQAPSEGPLPEPSSAAVQPPEPAPPTAPPAAEGSSENTPS